MSTTSLEEFAGGGDHKVPHWMNSLEEELDKKLIVLLRDGRNFVGHLRCFDQYANLMLEGTSERFVDSIYYADIFVGNIIIRGENVVLFGALDEQCSRMEEIPFGDILIMQQQRIAREGNTRNKFDCFDA
eukprot:GHVR01014118.1.p1 GENE.GHVR01014118.1~~GHVR01014118.1.p1  ORF type:complete len:139 (+),score=25.91 GHVR01014118.1:30-419(+)